MDTDPTSILGKRKRNVPLTLHEMEQVLWMVADKISDVADKVNFILLEEAEMLERVNFEAVEDGGILVRTDPYKERPKVNKI